MMIPALTFTHEISGRTDVLECTTYHARLERLYDGWSYELQGIGKRYGFTSQVKAMRAAYDELQTKFGN